MATENIILSSQYQLIVNATDNFLLSITNEITPQFEYVLADTQTAPDESLIGHTFKNNEQEYLNRDIIGSQFLYARSKQGPPITIVFSSWS